MAAVEPVADRSRLENAQNAAREAGVDALLVTPGPDLLPTSRATAQSPWND